MNIGSLKALFEKYEDDVEVCIASPRRPPDPEDTRTFEIVRGYDDDGGDKGRILVLQAGLELPPL